MKYFNHQAKLYRENLGLTLTELSALVGASFQTVQKWESGAVTPLPKRIPAIAKALRCSINDICDLCIDEGADSVSAAASGADMISRTGLMSALIDADLDAESLRKVLRIVKNFGAGN